MFADAASLSAQPTTPLLCVIVDAEEDFAWDGPLTAANNRVTSIARQTRAHSIFQHYGIKPTYLVTYPVVADAKARGAIQDWLASGLCDAVG